VTRREELDTRGRRLRAALAAVLVRDDAPELRLVHDWLDSWSGIGLIIAGMTHQGWDVQLTAYAARDWRANFFPVGIAHSIVGGSGWEPTPSRAVSRVTFHRDAALDLSSAERRAAPRAQSAALLRDIAEESANGRGQNPRPFVVLRVGRQCAFGGPNY
jgi:hypothetical protein